MVCIAFILCKYNIFSGLYYDFIGLLTGALYCTAPQGRIGGIESIQLGQTREIFETGATMVSPSKTAEKYAYQPCVFSPFCQVYIFYNLYILFHITRTYNPLFFILAEYSFVFPGSHQNLCGKTIPSGPPTRCTSLGLGEKGWIYGGPQQPGK